MIQVSLTPAGQRMVLDNLDLVRAIAFRFRGILTHVRNFHGSDFFATQVGQDLCQEGVLGLIRAVCFYDPSRGVKLSTYAWASVHRTISCYLLEKLWFKIGPYRSKYNPAERVKFFSDCWTPRDRTGDNQEFDVHDYRQPDPDDSFLDEQRQKIFLMLFLILSKRSAYIIRRYIIDEQSLDSISKELGVSKERIRQLKEKAMNRLRGNSDFVKLLRDTVNSRSESVDGFRTRRVS